MLTRWSRGASAGLAAATVALGLMVGVVVRPCVAAADCVGDCNQNGAVTVHELVRAVNIALEVSGFTVADCDAGDRNSDEAITVDEITTAVNYAVQNPGFTCTVAPTRTPTPSRTVVTPTPSEYACLRSGCSGEVCAERPWATICVWLPWYACYRTAVCEQQPNGWCGWTPTESLLQCLHKGDP